MIVTSDERALIACVGVEFNVSYFVSESPCRQRSPGKDVLW
jgi:hypothetical protein